MNYTSTRMTESTDSFRRSHSTSEHHPFLCGPFYTTSPPHDCDRMDIPLVKLMPARRTSPEISSQSILFNIQDSSFSLVVQLRQPPPPPVSRDENYQERQCLDCAMRTYFSTSEPHLVSDIVASPTAFSPSRQRPYTQPSSRSVRATYLPKTPE